MTATSTAQDLLVRFKWDCGRMGKRVSGFCPMDYLREGDV